MKIFRIVASLFVCSLFAMAMCVPDSFAADANILGQIDNKFYDEAERWSTVLEHLALQLFYWFLVADICIFGIRGALDMYKGNNIASLLAEFTVMILFVSFMFACLKNYKEWSNNLIDGLAQVGQQLGYSKASAGDLFRIGLDLASQFIDQMSLTSPVLSIAFFLVGVIFLCIFALIAAEIIVIKVESYIVMNAGIFLLGFGGMRYFKEYSINFLKYAFTVAVKLFVLQCLIGIAGSFFSGFTDTGLEWKDIGITLGGAVVMLALVKNIPSIISSLIMGAHGGAGGGSIFAAAATIGAASMAAAHAPRQIASAIETLRKKSETNAGEKSVGAKA